MLPIDIEILKYFLYGKPYFALKSKPYTETEQYEALKNRLEQHSNNPEMLTQSIKNASFTIFDLETTGLLPEIGHEIISIGAIRINGFEQIQYERFHRYIKPIRNVPKRTLRLTGMTEEELENGSSFIEAYSDFLEFSKDSVLVAYPAAFDMNFLNNMLKRWNLPVKTPYCVDAQQVVKKLYPNRKYQLDAMISYMGVTKLPRHHALNDAVMTAELFQQLLVQLYKYDIQTIEQLIKYTKKKDNQEYRNSK